MRKIYKYKLPVDGGVVTIDDYIVKILDLQAQDGTPTMWAIVDPEIEAAKPIEIIAIGTGWELPTGIDEYLGTVQDEYGFVWHYFLIQLKELDADVNEAFMQIGVAAKSMINSLHQFAVEAKNHQKGI